MFIPECLEAAIENARNPMEQLIAAGVDGVFLDGVVNYQLGCSIGVDVNCTSANCSKPTGPQPTPVSTMCACWRALSTYFWISPACCNGVGKHTTIEACCRLVRHERTKHWLRDPTWGTGSGKMKSTLRLNSIMLNSREVVIKLVPLIVSQHVCWRGCYLYARYVDEPTPSHSNRLL